MKKYVLLVLSLFVLAILASTAVYAEMFDPEAIALKQLLKTSAKKNAAGDELTKVKLTGVLLTTGVIFKLPSAVPEEPFLLQQFDVVNCTANKMTERINVSKTTSNSDSFTTSTTLGGETSASVTVDYTSPIGVGVSGTVSQSFNYSKTETKQTACTETVTWDVGYDVPKGPMTSTRVSFVISQKTLKNIPWSTNVILKGPAELTYGKMTTVCLYQQPNFEGNKKCWTTGALFLEVKNLQTTAWDSGTGYVGDGVASVKVTGDAKGARAELVFKDGGLWACIKDCPQKPSPYGSKIAGMTIRSMSTAKTETVQLEKYLTTEALSRIPLSGTYDGVSGVQASLRAETPVTLTTADCKAKDSASAPKAASNANEPPKQYKVLKSGIPPASVIVARRS